VPHSAGTSISTVSPVIETSQPSRRSTSAMMAMSVMRGTFVRTLRPGASRVAAISLSAEFFAPTTATSPARRTPPNTLSRSTGVSLGFGPCHAYI
jgi:hypothetical protein